MTENSPNSDSVVYRQLSEGMRNGLKDIYHQVSSASDAVKKNDHGANALFSEASDQLREVVRTTEEAAMNIMAIVEKQQEKMLERREFFKGIIPRLSAEEVEKITELNSSLEHDLVEVLTALSFQDLAGQRIKKVSEALNAIEKSVLELYLSSGLMLEGAEKDPAKDVETLQAEAQQAIDNFRGQKNSQLKGPDANGIPQGAIDDMLAQLGL